MSANSTYAIGRDNVNKILLQNCITRASVLAKRHT